MRKKAFTLIELVIVLSILTILSVAFTPAIVGAMRRSQLNACAEQLATHIRHARSVALAGGLPSPNNGAVQMIFTTGATQKYEAKSCSGNVFLQDPLTSQNFSVTLNNLNARSEFGGITFASGTIPPATGTGILVFDTEGQPFTDCGMLTEISTDAFVRLQNQSGQTRTVYVMRDTGIVSVETP